ncbi:MAG TPA: DUF1761 domain-containing protein [candidate division Zixibacteria bacterium]|nr:DUF1761 domain-containing protein [candidate division Zixibacteria bacterium]
MEFTTINYWAVIVSAVAYMVLGALWYSPVLFGNAWIREIGKTKEQVAADFRPVNYFIALLTSFLAAYGVARLMAWTGGDSICDGIIIGLLAGICFVMAAMAVNDTFEKRSNALTIINVLYHIVGLIIVGVIVGAWR